ncbi:MAG: helix-turn-helix transcriptional regulator, partial [Clostridia bacterium]|nr:helix-turn-helix transcriptional regulator [Clostridia bacterium]
MLTCYSVDLKLDSYGYLYMHLHEHYEMCYVLADNVSLVLEDKYLDVNMGDLFIIPPYTFHKFTSSKPYDLAYIFFDEYTFTKKAPALEQGFNYIKEAGLTVVHIPEEEIANVAQMFVDADTLYRDTEAFMYDFLNIQQFGNILHNAIKLHQTQQNSEQAHSSRNALIESILRYVSENLNENITTDMIMKRFNVSKTKLYMMMKESTGMSLKEFIIQLRLSRASELLSRGMSVTEASNKAGFNSYAHFIKIFKQKIGVSPYKYGKTLQNRYSLIGDSNG